MKKRNCRDCTHRFLTVCNKKQESIQKQSDDYCEFCEEKAVFLCYEENRHQLASECGAVNELKAFGGRGKAAAWALERVECGQNDGYIVDTEYGEVTLDRLLKELEDEECIDITMFNGHQENWDVSYDIIVQKAVVKQ